MPIDLGVDGGVESYPGHSGRTSSCASPTECLCTWRLLFSGWYPVCVDRTRFGWRDTLKNLLRSIRNAFVRVRPDLRPGRHRFLAKCLMTSRGTAEKMLQGRSPAEEAQRRYMVPEKFKNFPSMPGLPPSSNDHQALQRWQAGKS